MIDIGRDDGAAARHLVAHEVRRDEGRQTRAEILAVVEPGLRFGGGSLAADILAVGDIDHLGRDDAGAGELELGDGPAGKTRVRAPA